MGVAETWTWWPRALPDRVAFIVGYGQSWPKRALAAQAEDANWELRQQLKMRANSDALDRRVVHLTDRIWSQIDCTTCANCCKELEIQLSDADVQRLATRLQMSVAEVHTKYLEKLDEPQGDNDGYRWKMRTRPCPLLKDNRCTVYEDRPEQCRGYPYLHGKDFVFRTIGMIERASTCPIVYEVFAELRAEYLTRRKTHKKHLVTWPDEDGHNSSYAKSLDFRRPTGKIGIKEPHMTVADMEKRLRTVEREIAQLKANGHSAQSSNQWIEKVAGSFSQPRDKAAFDEATRLGRQWRRAQKDKARNTRKSAHK